MRNTSERLILKQGPCLVLQPEIVRHLGKSRALFLQQLHYWLTCEGGGIGKVVDQRRWIYNSAKDWAAQLCLSERQVSRIIHQLRDLGLLLVDRLSVRLSDRTNWYSINYRVLEAIFPNVSWQPLEKSSGFVSAASYEVTDKMSGSLGHNGRLYNKEPENTSETITIFSEEKLGFDLKNVSQQVNVVSRGREKKVFDKNSKGSVSSIQQPSTQNTTASDLLEIWNQTVSRQQGEGETFIQLTKKRAQHLVAAFKYRFGSNFDKWKEFCHQITTSDFLMGKVKSTFRASLDWVLKFDILQRIVEGDFGVQKNLFVNQKDSSWQEETVSQEIKASLESKHVQGFRLSVLRALGVKAYQSWFAQMSIREEGMDLVLTASSRFVRDYIQTHYGNKLLSLTSHRLNLS
jgi:hypothetical protein